MILTRSPLRISLGGGGTDLPSFYERHGGFLVAAAIQKYIYVSLHQTFVDEFILKYSEIERVKSVSDLRHPLVREALKCLALEINSLEISSFADIPSGTGLGSSGVFTCALIKALAEHKQLDMSKEELAELACHIEIDLLNEPSGKQDQYISVFGGLSAFSFSSNGKVTVRKLDLSEDDAANLSDSLVMFFTGYSRRSSSILAEQKEKSEVDNFEMLENLKTVKDIGIKSCEAIETGNQSELGRLMNEHWQMKKLRSKNMANQAINDCYDAAMDNGAFGGKLVGAGGGGFLLFVTDDRIATRKAMVDRGLVEVPIRFDYTGTTTLMGKS